MVGGLEAGGLEAVRRPMTATLALEGSRAVRKRRGGQLEVRTGAVRGVRPTLQKAASPHFDEVRSVLLFDRDTLDDDALFRRARAAA